MSNAIAQALVARLKTDNTVSSLVSGRIAPIMAERNEPLPFIRYYRVSGQPLATSGGVLKTYEARYQIDIYAESYGECVKISDAVQGVLHTWRGDQGDVTVSSCYVEREADEEVDPGMGREKPVFHVSHDYVIWYSVN